MAKEIDVNVLDQTIDDMRLYAIYVAKHRAVADFRDGFKDVQRKIIYSMWKDGDPRVNKKSASVVGTVMYKYHPHGDEAIYSSIKPMVNWFEIYIPLINKQGNFGNFQGDKASASRYTEVKLSPFSMDCVIGDMKLSDKVVDWEKNYDGTVDMPSFLAPNLPMLLINGSFGIAVGFKVEIPKHNINEVIDAMISLINNPNQNITLIPDTCMPCDIIKSDFETISNNGHGNYKVRGKIDIGEYKGKTALFIHSVPDLVYLDNIVETIEQLIVDNKITQIYDIYENSTENKMEYIIMLKKGSDPNFVRDTIYRHTNMEKTCRVNFEVLCDRNIVRMSYTDYLLRFIDFRKDTKLRLYYNLLQNDKTKYHEREAYIRLLESGEIDKVIDMIKKQKGTDDVSLIEYLVKRFKITDLQAKKIINSPIKYLSKGYLSKYKSDAKELIARMKIYIDKIRNEDILNKEIIEELLDYKKRYGTPRRSQVISKSETANIPEGEFRLILTENNFIKKFGMEENVGSFRGDNPKIALTVQNSDDILLFDESGKVFSYPVHRIPLTERGGAGTDIRFLSKRMTSNISVIMGMDFVKKVSKNKNNYLAVLTHNGYIKRVKLKDFTTVTAGGLIYSRLEEGDSVKDIVILHEGMDIVVYSKRRGLRIASDDIPVQHRSTRGVRSMISRTDGNTDGMCVVTNGAYIVVVTTSGYINKFDVAALPVSKRGRAGSSMIKLNKTDSISSIHILDDKDDINITMNINNKVVTQTINIGSIPVSSSISKGEKIKGNLIVLRATPIRK